MINFVCSAHDFCSPDTCWHFICTKSEKLDDRPEIDATDRREKKSARKSKFLALLGAATLCWPCPVFIADMLHRGYKSFLNGSKSLLFTWLYWRVAVLCCSVWDDSVFLNTTRVMRHQKWRYALLLTSQFCKAHCHHVCQHVAIFTVGWWRGTIFAVNWWHYYLQWPT